MHFKKFLYQFIATQLQLIVGHVFENLKLFIIILDLQLFFKKGDTSSQNKNSLHTYTLLQNKTIHLYYIIINLN